METVFAKDRAEWRRWLAKNFSRSEEIWLVFYRKAAGKPSVSYDHAVEEALCFGWIDGQKKKLDEECYAFRFTPRKPNSQWSKSNLVRVERLIAAGKMMPAGLKLYNSGDRREVAPMPTEMPRDLRRPLSQAARGVGELREVPARLPASDGGMGGEREEGRDADETPGEANRVFGAQRTHHLYVNLRVHVISGVTWSQTLTAIASGVPRPSIKRKRCGSRRANS